MMHRHPIGALAASGLLVILPAPALSAGGTVATWEMNEAAGGRVMTDTSGHLLNGTIGDAVQSGVPAGGSIGYRFPAAGRTLLRPGRLVTVADNPHLDPGERTYNISLRMRTTKPHGNLIQKGQSATPGGHFKIQSPNGIVQCLFRGSAGSLAVGSGRRLNDGRWHTLRCTRTSLGVSLSVDGDTGRIAKGTTGTISNTFPLSIGGKTSCNQTTVSCDYYAGDIDRVAITAG